MDASYEVGYKKPPKNRQFGKPEGNPQRRGQWDIKSSARYKLERMMELSAEEVQAIANDKDAPLFERRLAKSLLKENEFKTTEAMINQVYGYPKQEVQQTIIEPPEPLSPRRQKDSEK